MRNRTYNDRVRAAFAAARDEASALGHEYVGTEHLLLAILAVGGGVAVAVIENLGAPHEEMRSRILSVVERGRGRGATDPNLPYTSRAKVAVEFATDEARLCGHDDVDTEHLLLGLIREERGIAAQLLAASGVRLENARAETRRLLGEPPAPLTPPDANR